MGGPRFSMAIVLIIGGRNTTNVDAQRKGHVRTQIISASKNEFHQKPTLPAP